MTGETGAGTVEAALAVATLVFVLVLCVGGLTAVSAQIRCIDAAREAARLAARGDDGTSAVRAIAPAGAVLALRVDGGFVSATVSTSAGMLPGITVSARAVSAVEVPD
ncbi:TadE family type IV pilus minor pilin [Mycolicibacterium komossense]|uniref:Pilus assembly protein n=1 Tax=Mycolicibacterium komossense TaxID=1779 RepID=A0ABT3CLR3_9MYCO|nr:TadE family type IV pilus minor pilin [Mycolicibacterium komossense]MCV7230458.1 pilus assembly protein [Mycolicibacterium komossense]